VRYRVSGSVVQRAGCEVTDYYNEIDPAAAQWLRNLIDAGHLTPGYVDERSIEDVYPSDLRGFTQCHFFAGIGVWAYALRQAGWPSDRPVWTGSCPCQPFSAAGKGAGFDDERHLWPAFHHLIKECKPATVIGEQVASKDADSWIDLVHTDLEALGYAFGAIPYPSASVGSPHIRDRLYWVGNTSSAGLDKRIGVAGVPSWQTAAIARKAIERTSICSGGVEYATGDGWEQRGTESGRGSIAAGCPPSGMADTLDSTGHGSLPRGIIRELPQGVGAMQTECRPTGPVNGRWSDADWLFCRDGKWRPVEPGTFPLANGAPARVVRLRAYGNAINAVQAQTFIESVMEAA